MAKKINKINIRIEVAPKSFFGRSASERDCEQIISEINRHVDNVDYCEVIWDTKEICEYCGYTWDETEACCDKAQEEFLINMKKEKKQGGV